MSCAACYTYKSYNATLWMRQKRGSQQITIRSCEGEWVRILLLKYFLSNEELSLSQFTKLLLVLGKLGQKTMPLSSVWTCHHWTSRATHDLNLHVCEEGPRDIMAKWRHQFGPVNNMVQMFQWHPRVYSDFPMTYRFWLSIFQWCSMQFKQTYRKKLITDLF